MTIVKEKAEFRLRTEPFDRARVTAVGMESGEGEMIANDVYVKTCTWVDQRAGDCHMTGILTLRSDGSALWDCTTWTDSTHNKDVWHETLRVYNAQNQEIFGFGVWGSPPMDSPPNGGQYHWTNSSSFPPSLWDAATSATSQGEC